MFSINTEPHFSKISVPWYHLCLCIENVQKVRKHPCIIPISILLRLFLTVFPISISYISLWLKCLFYIFIISLVRQIQSGFFLSHLCTTSIYGIILHFTQIFVSFIFNSSALYTVIVSKRGSLYWWYDILNIVAKLFVNSNEYRYLFRGPSDFIHNL